MKPSQKIKIKVAFNVSCLQGGGLGGWARYTSELLHHLELLYSDQLELYLFKNERRHNHTFWEQFILPNLCVQQGIDILHAPANGGLCWRGNFKKILTVHDLFSEEDFRWSDHLMSPRALKNAFRYKLDWQLSLEAADHLITVSDFCLNALLDKGHSKAVRIYEGGLREGSFAQVLKSQEASENYFLYVGSADQRKRVHSLVDEFAEVSQKFASFAEPLKLVLIGKGTQKVAAAKNCSWIEAFDSLPNEKLLQYYAACSAFISFSEKEGFGLPLVEAMSFGKPVFYRGGGSISEICGEAGILVPEAGLEVTLRNWQINPEEQKRLSQAAHQRGQFFSWKKTAEETFRLYQEAYAALLVSRNRVPHFAASISK